MKVLLGVLMAQVVWVAVMAAGVSSALNALVMRRRERDVGESSTSSTIGNSNPRILSMHVTSNIEYRFAHTVISSKVGNPANVSQEVVFSVTLPESAFISRFLMEIDGQVYEASVKEKQEAKQEYDAAVSAGLGAAHVAVSARDSNRFTVSVNVEPAKKVNFNLTYEELLARRLGAYNHVVNIDPGQVVADLRVDVHIKENKNITTLRVPELRSGNEVDADETTAANQLARIDRPSGREAHVSFAPSEGDQKRVGRVKGFDAEGGSLPQAEPGLGGQFVVQYDVDRSDKAGEVLVDNGYFVHFFSPVEETPLPKHAIFVLDVSGSMMGRKMEQLKDAMAAILAELREGDYFTIIHFSSGTEVWNLEREPPVFTSSNHPETMVYPASSDFIQKAKERASTMRASGGTNIHEAVRAALRVVREGQKVSWGEGRRPSPLILFLTDGEPTVGETRLPKILTMTQEFNSDPEAAIFSLAFGDDADLDFLKKLSLRNSGFARKIYEASDAALQLRDFYRQISSPLLANVTFSYQPDKIDSSMVTRTRFHTLFRGSEIIVAGRMLPNLHLPDSDLDLEGQVSAEYFTGHCIINLPHPIPVIREEVRPVTSLERLWAYLTIKQLLDEDAKRSVEDDALGHLFGEPSTTTTTTSAPPEGQGPSPKKKALQLALKYSFVTPLTSLVVVKPNSTETTGVEKVSRSEDDGHLRMHSPASSYSSPRSGHPHYMQPLSANYMPMSVPIGARAPVMQHAPPRHHQDSHMLYSSRPAFDVQPSFAFDDMQTDMEMEKVTLKPRPTLTAVPTPVSMDELTWLAGVTNPHSGTITLPFASLPGNKTYQLERNNQTTVALKACHTEHGGEGLCRHLSQCSLSAFKDDISKYEEFFCEINNFAGVCCPKSLFPEVVGGSATPDP